MSHSLMAHKRNKSSNYETIKLWLKLISFVNKLISNPITQLVFYDLRYEIPIRLRFFCCNECQRKRVSKYIFTLKSCFRI